MNRITIRNYNVINFLFWFFVYVTMFSFALAIKFRSKSLFYASEYIALVSFGILFMKVFILGFIAFSKPKRTKIKAEQPILYKKHFTVLVRGHVRYMCNQAVNVSMEKCTTNEKRVTCKNCLRVLDKK